MKKTFLYVDGFNLYYSAVKDTPLKWLNPARLASHLFRQNQIGFVKYFSAKVDARPGDPEAPLRQQVYWRALRTIPDLRILEGDFRTRKVRAAVVQPPPPTIEVYKTEEKRSDVNLASNLLLDAFRGRFEAAIVISGDSDLVTPIQMVRQELGLPIGVLNPQRVSGPGARPERKSAGLKEASTFYRNYLTWSQLENAQFPPTLQDTQGAFHKPLGW